MVYRCIGAGKLPVQMTTDPAPTFRILDIDVNALDLSSATQCLERMIVEKEQGYVVFCTVSTLLHARDEPAVADAVREAAYVMPDGMPLVWLGRRNHQLPVRRVYGPELMTYFFSTTENRFRHYFFGGSEESLRLMVANLRDRFPNLDIVGYHSPGGISSGYDAKKDRARINAQRPDVVWVGLGHPKQELWMRTELGAVDAPIMAGVGAAFDFLSGLKREAPTWMQRAGLQWLHRLLSEPRRLWRRYVVGNIRFLWLIRHDILTSSVRSDRGA